jgi:AraC-like DNA-binding protein
MPLHAGRILMTLAGRTQPLVLGGPAAPSVSGASTSWRGLPFELHRMQAVPTRPIREPIEAGPLAGEFGLLVILEGEVAITSRDGARCERNVGRPGSVAVLAGDALQRVEKLEGSARAAAINVPPAWLERMELSERWARRSFVHDPTVHGFVRTIRAEIAGGAGSGAAFADSISLSLLSHVAERHGFGPGTSIQTRGQLSPVQRERLREHVRANLASDLRLTSLSAEIGVSPRHFITLFRRTFGTSPHRYVLEQRLAEGERLIAAGERDLAALALSVGFSSQSHFTTAFRASRGTTPARFSRRFVL